VDIGELETRWSLTLADFNDLLGICLGGYDGDVYRLELVTRPQHMHAAGSVHGGVILSLLDTVMSRAVRSHLPDCDYMPTMNLSANFFRPMGEGLISAEGRVVNSSRRTVCAEGKLYGGSGKLLAQGTASFMRIANAG